MWIWFTLLPVAAYLSLLLHELSHLLVMKAVGAEITSFKPYPHTEDGQFWFGRVNCRFQNGFPADYRFSHIAPIVKSSTLVVAWLLLGLLVYRPLLLFAACEVVDWTWWFVGWNRPGKDAYKWRTATLR